MISPEFSDFFLASAWFCKEANTKHGESFKENLYFLQRLCLGFQQVSSGFLLRCKGDLSGRPYITNQTYLSEKPGCNAAKSGFHEDRPREPLHSPKSSIRLVAPHSPVRVHVASQSGTIG